MTSDKEAKIAPIREAFIDIFGRATVKGIASQSSTIAEQPVGAAAALQAAEERTANIRHNHNCDVPQNQVIVSVESFLAELTPERFVTIIRSSSRLIILLLQNSWFDIGCLLLDDPLTGTKMVTYTQATPVPTECVNALKFETPAEYAKTRQGGFSVTIGQQMAQRLDCPNDQWHEAHVGIPRRSLVYLSACALARLFKNRTFAR